MKWKPGRTNPRLEDRRGQGGGGFSFPGSRSGGGLGFPMPSGGGRKMGLGTILIVVVIFLVLRSCSGGEDGGGGFDVPGLPSGQSQVPGVDETTAQQPAPGESDAQDQGKQFVNFVLTDLDTFWTGQFESAGRQLQPPGLVLFSDAVASGCGQASSATGPFYCPLDQKAYVDLTFFRELDQRFKAPGDFAQAYVLAHEYGHHIQQQLGIEEKVRSQSQSDPDDANELSVRLELQADCFSGLWGRSVFDQGILEDGDLEEGITAAEAVGDDRIQEQTQGRINPETFTHGTSEQRREWFRRGFDSGRFEECDTFSADEV
jgi:predicted metalloprotease